MLDRVLAERSWHRDRSKAIASRFPIVEDYPRSAEKNEQDRRYTAILYRVRLRGPDGREFMVGCLHMPTSRYAFGQLFRLDPRMMTLYLNWWNDELQRMFELLADLGDLPVLVGGDFNNGPDSSRMADLRESGLFQSAFDTAGLGWGYTRPSEFPWARGSTHILANSPWTGDVVLDRSGVRFRPQVDGGRGGASRKAVTTGRWPGAATGIRVA